LTAQLAAANEENATLKAKVQELELVIDSLEKGGGVKSKLQAAIATDGVVNPEDAPAE